MGYYPTGNDHRQLPRREQQYMRRWIAAALMCLCLALAIAPGTALADSGGWTYDPGAQTLINGSVTLKNVTADGDGGITIGRQDTSAGDLDLTGTVSDSSGKTYAITGIGEWAFSYGGSPTSIVIPGSVRSIGRSAFEGCRSLKSVSLSEGLESIGEWAFYACYSLESIVIPSSVRSIGLEAFLACYNLSSVAALSQEPPLLGVSVFREASNNLSILVPASSLGSYERGWASYAGRLRAGYTLTADGERVGALYTAGDVVSLSSLPDRDACHSFVGWRVILGEGSVEGNSFTMGDSDAILEATYDEHHTWGAGGHCTVCGETNPDFRPSVTSGDNADWHMGEQGGLTFTSDAAYADFERVLVDGVEVDRSLYTVEEGSTIVTFGASYLESLGEGDHTVSIVSSTGTVSAKFTVLPAADPDDGEADGGVSPDGGVTPDGGTAPDGETVPDGETNPDGVTPDDGTVPDGGTTPDGGVAPSGNTNSDGGAAPDGNAGSNGAANGGSDASPEGAASGSGAEALAATGDSSLPSAAVATLGAALAAAGALVLGRRRG